MTVVYPDDIPMTPEEEEYWAEIYPDSPDHYDEDVFNEFEADFYYQGEL